MTNPWDEHVKRKKVSNDWYVEYFEWGKLQYRRIGNTFMPPWESFFKACFINHPEHYPFRDCTKCKIHGNCIIERIEYEE